MSHDSSPAELIGNVQEAIAAFALDSGRMVLGTLGELKAASERLHLAARSLYLATQVEPEAEVALMHYDETSAEAEVPAAELASMFALPSEPVPVRLSASARPLEDNGVYSAVATRMNGQRATMAYGADGKPEVDVSVQLAYALEAISREHDRHAAY